jgi:hypothetical protein
MTKTLEALLEATGRTMAEIRSGEVCDKCKDDSTCEECAFFNPPPKTNPPHHPASKSDHNHQQEFKSRYKECRGGILTGINLDIRIEILV